MGRRLIEEADARADLTILVKAHTEPHSLRKVGRKAVAQVFEGGLNVGGEGGRLGVNWYPGTPICSMLGRAVSVVGGRPL